MDDTFSGADFSEAASASSASAETPASESTSAESTAPVTTEQTTDPAATVQAAETVTPPVTPEKPKGPIPFEAHHTALENARIKAREEFQAEWRQKHGWAEQADRQAVEQMDRMGRLFRTDPAAWTRQYFTEALNDPALSSVIRSEAARLLGTRTPPQGTGEIEPDIPVLDPNGQVVNHAYSASAVKQLVQRAVEDAIGKKVAPLEQDFQTRQKAAEQAAYDKRLDDAVSTDRAFVEKRPYWKEHGSAITKHYAANPQFVTLKDAYYDYVETSILPNLSKTERTQVIQQLNGKTAASSVSPSSGTTSLPISDDEKSWEDLLREEAKAMGI